MTACKGLIQMNPEHKDCGSKYNQCWSPDYKTFKPEEFKFLIYDNDTKIVASDFTELSNLVEETTKRNGFMFDAQVSTLCRNISPTQVYVISRLACAK